MALRTINILLDKTVPAGPGIVGHSDLYKEVSHLSKGLFLRSSLTIKGCVEVVSGCRSTIWSGYRSGWYPLSSK